MKGSEEMAVNEAFSIIDCDVHPNVDRGLPSVYPYMPEAWRQRFMRKRSHLLSTQLTVKFTHPNGSIQREDARPHAARLAASDPAFLLGDLVDAHGISRVILNSLQSCTLCAALMSADESVVCAAAFNDFYLDRWLPLDPRFTLAMVVPSQDPAAAAAEIARVGRRPQVVAVAVPMINTLLGDRRWWPIYAAARELGLPMLLHGSGTEGVIQGAPSMAGGIGDSYIERYLGMAQVAEANIASLIFTGTLERFRELKFVFVEFGFLWLLPLLWRMDRVWRQLRHEVPWVARAPIDCVYDQCRFSTQPLDEPEDPRNLERMASMIGWEHLCFSSDYPHWDNEMPGHVFRGLPVDVRRKIFQDNALGTFRFN